MHNQNKHNKIVQRSFAAICTVFALASASASVLPVEKLSALQCANSES